MKLSLLDTRPLLLFVVILYFDVLSNVTALCWPPEILHNTLKNRLISSCDVEKNVDSLRSGTVAVQKTMCDDPSHSSNDYGVRDME